MCRMCCGVCTDAYDVTKCCSIQYEYGLKSEVGETVVVVST